MQVDLTQVEDAARELYVRALKILPAGRQGADSIDCAASETSAQGEARPRHACSPTSRSPSAPTTCSCQDTGVPIYNVDDRPRRRDVDGAALKAAMRRGCARATREHPLRSSIVHPLTRANEHTSCGIERAGDPRRLLRRRSTSLTIEMIPKGSGSENNSLLRMAIPAEGVDAIKTFVDRLRARRRRRRPVRRRSSAWASAARPTCASRLAKRRGDAARSARTAPIPKARSSRASSRAAVNHARRRTAGPGRRFDGVRRARRARGDAHHDEPGRRQHAVPLGAAGERDVQRRRNRLRVLSDAWRTTSSTTPITEDAGARAARQRHRHACNGRCSASATRRRSRCSIAAARRVSISRGHAVIHTAPNVRKVEQSAAASGRLRAALRRHDDVRPDGALHRAADGAVRRAARSSARAGCGEGSLAAFGELGGAYLAIIGGAARARDDVDRADRGRRPRRSQPGVAVAVPRARLRAAAGRDGQPRRQRCTTSSMHDAQAARAQVLRTLGVARAVTLKRVRDRHPDPRLRRRRAVRRAARAPTPIPSLSITIAVKGLLGKCGCTRMVQGGYNVALAAGDSVERHFMDTIEGGKWLAEPGSRVDAGDNGAIERIHELENELGCFFDRNPDGTVHQKAFAGPDVRSHGAQGRSHRHRDHQPARRAGLGARHRAAGGASRASSSSRRRDGSALAGVLMIDMRTGEFVLVEAQGGAARDRRRPDDVPVSHAVGRQELRRHGDGAARRPAACATWRWCSSIRRDCSPARTRG